MTPCPCCGRPLETPAAEIALISQGPFSPLERRICLYLLETMNAWVPSERLISRVYENDRGGGALTANNSVTVAICRIRPKLRRIGLTIEGRSFGRGGGGERRITRLEKGTKSV